MKTIHKILIFLLVLIPTRALSQADINIFIDNQQDSVLYFCKYRGSKTLVLDTLKLEKGLFRHFRIKNDTKFPEGIYLLKNDRNIPMFEILIGKKQRFTIMAENLGDLNSFTVKGAKETANYFKLMAKLRQNDLIIAGLDSEKDIYPDNQRKIDSLKQDFEKFKESLKIRRKDAFINVVINSVKRRTMENYWEDFRLDDERIITYPLIDNKLETYFNNLPPDAETINAEIDKLIVKTGDCEEVRDYLIWFFYVKYFNPSYMNLDDVYIHIVDEYFLKLEMKNVSESVVNMMADRAAHLEYLKLGSSIPPIGNLYYVESQYIALIFYDKTCQKCAREGRILEEVRSRHPEMVIFPVEINSTDIKDLMALYDLQTTPMIYLLDSKKRIIAKRIKAEQVEQFLKTE